jgi:hypothetical protein
MLLEELHLLPRNLPVVGVGPEQAFHSLDNGN